uniref:Host attachment protein n=1 Tax=Leptospirillum ferriphilum TaxID=178606 RepID=A0A7C3QUB6_9BACT
MQTAWVLIAGKAGARVLSCEPGEKDSWTLVLSIEHPAGRLREQEMVSDRAGRSFHRRGDKVSHAGGHPAGQVMHEEEVFAKKLSGFLEKSRRRALYYRLYVVAGPGFAGILKKKMDPRTLQTVTGFIHQDLGNPTVEGIRKALSGKIFPGPPLSGKVRVQKEQGPVL